MGKSDGAGSGSCGKHSVFTPLPFSPKLLPAISPVGKNKISVSQLFVDPPPSPTLNSKRIFLLNRAVI